MAEQDYVHMPTLEEYSERFKDFFKFKRSDDGILEVRMHTSDSHVRWSYQMHHAISELWTTIGHDTKNEILIFTSTGEKWINEVDASSFQEVEQSDDDDQRFNVQIYDTLKVVVHSLEMRDYYTIGHGRRVALFAKAIAEQMEWDEDRLKIVEMGGILHDVGKIGIEDAILRKQAELSEEEVEQMQFHPEIGTRIVRDVEFLKPVVPFILYHQEQYDGTGHPYQLKGDEIPIEGRLLAVADAFDAMTSDRPYRKAMPADKAIGLIRDERGKQFDPEVVDAFLLAWDKGKITVDMLASAEKVKVVECPCCSSKMTIDPRSTNPFLIHCPVCHERAGA